MKFEIVFILSCFCVHFSTSSDNAATDLENKERSHLLKLMYGSVEPKEKHLQQKYTEEYRQKYGDRQIEISSVTKDNTKILISKEKIFIDHGLAPQFLKAFSGSIRKLSIAYNHLPEDIHKNIGHLVNVHCSDTLEEFQAKKCRNGAFDEMKKPFKKVTTVIFDGDWQAHADDNLGLDQLFPAMRVFTFTYSDGYIYQRKYPNLVEVNTFETTAYNFGQLLANNPQIKKLRVEDTSMGFLRYANEILPKLETLAFNVPLDLAQYQEAEIQFEHVNDLAINDYHQRIKPGKFAFKNLKDFKLLVNGNIEGEWINFIENHKGLETLTITTGNLNDVTLSVLSKKFTGLLKATINCDSSISVESVVEFIENNKHMNEFNLNLEKGSSMFFKNLAKKLDKKWKITTSDEGYSVLSATRIVPFTGEKDEEREERIDRVDNDKLTDESSEDEEETDEEQTDEEQTDEEHTNNLREETGSHEQNTQDNDESGEEGPDSFDKVPVNNHMGLPDTYVGSDESSENGGSSEETVNGQGTGGSPTAGPSTGGGADFAKCSMLAVLAITTVILFI